MKIRQISARAIYDSRGNPTIEAEALLECGARGVAAAPSGASTGSHEARELRDGGKEFGGKGVERAAEGVQEISKALCGMDAARQRQIDERMILLDGTEDKSRLGGNAMIAVSLAVAASAAQALRLPLWKYLGGAQGGGMPIPMMNVLNGGAHADNNLDIQEFMIVPVGARDFQSAMRMGAVCYHALRQLLRERGLQTAVGDEGGFAPNLSSDEQALELLVEAISRAGFRPGEEVALALDMAASEWGKAVRYHLPKSGKEYSSEELKNFTQALVEKYPILSVEDPLGEEDFSGFAELTESLRGKALVVGDDLFTTNPTRIAEGIRLGAGSAVLVKPNQIGTLTETLDAINLARSAGLRVILSHRSGETENTAIADIACAVNAEFIKSGAPARSERVAKYNRLLRIEAEI